MPMSRVADEAEDVGRDANAERLQALGRVVDELGDHPAGRRRRLARVDDRRRRPRRRGSGRSRTGSRRSRRARRPRRGRRCSPRRAGRTGSSSRGRRGCARPSRPGRWIASSGRAGREHADPRRRRRGRSGRRRVRVRPAEPPRAACSTASPRRPRFASGTAEGTKPISPFSSFTSSSIVFSPSSTSLRYSSSFPSSDASAIVTWIPRTSAGSACSVLAGTGCCAAGSVAAGARRPRGFGPVVRRSRTGPGRQARGHASRADGDSSATAASPACGFAPRRKR